MPRLSVAAELESAANRIDNISRADLQIMLRRAALVLRNVTGVTLDPAADESINGIAAEMRMSKPELIKTILGDWLVANAYLPVPYALDEESATDGSA
ncbi:hypothetical protein NKH72_17035 [Mesorhizobium sp. M0955]